MNNVPVTITLSFALAVAALQAPSLRAQDASGHHPKKEVLATVAEWPTTGPGKVKLEDFQPFRAVYERQYKQGSGPNAGAERADRVILSAEEVAWDGHRAVAISIQDSGAAEHADTNARAFYQVSDLETLRVLFEIGPVPGKGKDYYVARVEAQSILLNMVATESQELTPQKIPTGAPGFGAGAWVMASMPLAEGQKIRLAPYYSPQANLLSASDHGRVLGRREFIDARGQKHQAWVVETGAYHRLSSPKVQHIYLSPKPPYYLGTETVDLDSGERRRFVWLRQFEMFQD